jgi:hypothetical protein
MAKEKQVIIVLDDADTINGNCIIKLMNDNSKKSDKNGHRYRHK